MNKEGHTVEKIGGTSMLETEALLENVLVGAREGSELYVSSSFPRMRASPTNCSSTNGAAHPGFSATSPMRNPSGPGVMR